MRNGRFLFKDDTGDLFTMNATGALVYRLYSEGLTSRAIAKRLAARYRIPLAQALDDVLAFLAQVRANGLVLKP